MIAAKPGILLLLPDARLRDIYASRFERDGWEVDSSSNLVDAERRAVQMRPSVLLIHASLIESAKATFKHLRSLPTLLKTRIVVMDRHLPRPQIDELLKLGAAGVMMTAHLTPQALVKSLNQLIEEV